MTLDEFRIALNQLQEGPREAVLRVMPLLRGTIARQRNEARRIKGIIDAMTPKEREFPFVPLTDGHVRRIASGAGVAPHAVIELLENVKLMNVMLARARLRTFPPTQ